MAPEGIETAQRSANEESEQIAGTAPELVPARMLNEYAYCPRLAYLEWVQGEFADSVDTVEGRFQHRRVDRPSGNLPLPSVSDAVDTEEGEERKSPETIHARSVLLSDDALGTIARIDLIESQGNVVTPVDYKHGTVPDLPEGTWVRNGSRSASRACRSALTGNWGRRIALGDATALTQNGLRQVIKAYKRWTDTLVTHHLFDYPVSYRRVLEMRVRLLSRHLIGELPAYPVFRTV